MAKKSNKGIKLTIAIIVLILLIAGFVGIIIKNKPEEQSRSYAITVDEDHEHVYVATVNLSDSGDVEECQVVRFVSEVADCEHYVLKVSSENAEENISIEDIYLKVSGTTNEVATQIEQDQIQNANYIVSVESVYQNYGLGALILLILIVLDIIVIIILATKTTDSIKSQFDERQLIARGKASMYGMIVSLIYSASIVVLDFLKINLPADMGVLFFIGIALAIVVFAGYSIMHEAYFALNTNRKGMIVVFAICALGSLVLSIYSIVNKTCMVDGKLAMASCYWVCTILFVFVLIMFIIKKAMNAKEAE